MRKPESWPSVAWVLGAACAAALGLAGCTITLPRRLLTAGWDGAAGLPWAHRRLLVGAFTDVVSADRVLYLLETLPHRAEPMQLLVRVDLRTGSVGSTVQLIRPAPWAVLRTVHVHGGQVQSLSFTPDRHRVYLAIARSQTSGVQRLEERTLPGWRLVNADGVPRNLDIGSISAAGSSLWVQAGGGTTGQVQLFTADLRHVRLVLGAGELARGQEE
jgi:hypothetical protein